MTAIKNGIYVEVAHNGEDRICGISAVINNRFILPQPEMAYAGTFEGAEKSSAYYLNRLQNYLELKKRSFLFDSIPENMDDEQLRQHMIYLYRNLQGKPFYETFFKHGRTGFSF